MKFLGDRVLGHLREQASRPDLSGTPYRFVRVLGAGGMGQVFLVEDSRLERQVALKVLNTAEPTAEQRRLLEREARIIAGLEHPGIVPIYDIGVLPDKRNYYTMLYVHGKDLEHYSSAALSMQERLRLFLKICEAVAFAHARGLIHRDLKPANIMVGEFGAIWVMDWGIAKALRRREDNRSRDSFVADEKPGVRSADQMDTRPGLIMGTPAYMAPEQARGRVQEHSKGTDVYALGAILHFLLVSNHASGTDPRRKRNIPKRLHAIIRKAMRPPAEDRYADAAELAADIERYLGNLPVSAYRERVWEKALRLLIRHRFIAFLVFAYMLVRFILFFWGQL